VPTPPLTGHILVAFYKGKTLKFLYCFQDETLSTKQVLIFKGVKDLALLCKIKKP
jgi:hypothetical protein